MWISRRKSSREIHSIDGVIRRSSSKHCFVRSSLKDVENLFANDEGDTSGFDETLGQPSTCSTADSASATTTAAARRLSIFHRVHLANRFARAFSATQISSPEKSLLESKNDAAAAEILTKSPPESNDVTAAEILANFDHLISTPAKYPPESNNVAALAEKLAKSLSESNNVTAAMEKLAESDRMTITPAKSPPELNNVTASAERLTKSPPESNNAATAAEKLTKSDCLISTPAKSPPESNNVTAAEKLTKSDRLISIPGAEKRVVVYTTSLRVVRPTFEACRSVQSILRGFRVSIDERDLSMDSRFLDELHNIMAEDDGGCGGDATETSQKTKLTLPRVFIGGKYIGGAEEVKQLQESGELKKYIEGLPAVSSGVCDGCGDVRFILCDECRGSHKCYTEKGGFRSCTLCNENGLVWCPSCLGR